MTTALEQAFVEVSGLPEVEQDRIASLILGQLPGDQRWTELFAHPKSPELLERLAAEARAEIGRGEVYPLGNGL